MSEGTPTMGDDLPTYLTPETLAEYFRSGTPTVQALSHEPRCSLRIDPRPETLELYVPHSGAEPDVSAFERLTVDVVEFDGDEWYRLRVDARGVHHEAYSLIASVVDDMREGVSFVKATANALVAFRELLTGRQSISTERQEGLIGELLVLRHAVSSMGPAAALDAWLGPASEQHDFGFVDFDAEVKTTRSESRVHVIGTETQLQPSLDRPLWLVSVQLTRAGRSAAAVSLAGLVGELRQTFDGQGNRFLEYLASVGWRDADQDLYTTRYILRASPAAYHVDDRFPAVTRSRLDAVIPQAELVSAVSYRVDVTNLDPGSPPQPLTSFVD